MKSRLIFTLCSSSSCCSVFPHFQFLSKTKFFATLSFLNAFSWLLPHTPLSEKNTLPLKSPFFSSQKMKTPCQPSPALYLSHLASLHLFQPSASLHPQPPPWQGGGIYGHTSQHAQLLQKPALTLPKMLPTLLGLWHLVKKNVWKRSPKWGSTHT